MKQVLNTAPWAYSEVLGDSPVGAGPGALQGGKGGASERTHGGGHAETPGARSTPQGRTASHTKGVAQAGRQLLAPFPGLMSYFT